jgi:type II secretory pathway pseudopilin PulG
MKPIHPPVPVRGTNRFVFRKREGFSLIELLIVLNILIYFFWMVAPMLSSILTGQGVSEAAFELSSAVERARNEAVTRKTYVWLGIQEEVQEGNLGLRIGTVCSKDGTANTNAANLMPLGATVLIPKVGLVGIGSATAVAPTASAVDLLDFTGGTKFQIGKNSFVQGRTVTFMPLGEAATNAVPTAASGFNPLLMLVLRQTHGTNLFPGNDVILAIDGSVGTPTLYRK